MIEYKVIYGGRDGIPLIPGKNKDEEPKGYYGDLERGLNKLGKDGWKLGAIAGSTSSIFVFWREKR